MLTENLFEMVYMILEKGKLTAKTLADHFSVSSRTIYRWVDDLCVAGIPLYSENGRNGGISIMPGYTIDKTMFSDAEKQNILTAIKSFQLVEPTNNSSLDTTLSKLAVLFNTTNPDWIEIDFSTWNYSQENKNAFYLLKDAILKKQTVSFLYFGGNGQKVLRVVEPWRLVFKEQSWYLFAFCRLRKAPRFFKLRRIKELSNVGETFFSSAPKIDYAEYNNNVDKYKVKAIIKNEALFRVYDEFFDFTQKKIDENSIEAEFTLPKEDWIYSYILTFGSNLEILEPIELRQKIISYVNNIYFQYNKN